MALKFVCEVKVLGIAVQRAPKGMQIFRIVTLGHCSCMMLAKHLVSKERHATAAASKFSGIISSFLLQRLPTHSLLGLSHKAGTWAAPPHAAQARASWLETGSVGIASSRPVACACRSRCKRARWPGTRHSSGRTRRQRHGKSSTRCLLPARLALCSACAPASQLRVTDSSCYVLASMMQIMRRN